MKCLKLALKKNFKHFSNGLINGNNKSGLGFNYQYAKNFCEQNKDTRQEHNETSSKFKDYPEIIKLLFEQNIKNKKLPCFEVYSSQIEILNQPFDFYLAIIVKIRIILFIFLHFRN
jgi:hypothetical protein